MNVYPHSSALILNDTEFIKYGGQFGDFTPQQRSAAYVIAEKQATKYIGTFLLPTIVTGTFGHTSRVVTDYGYVSRILAVNILSKDSLSSCTLHSDSACAWVYEDTFGYLDISCVINHCNCAGWLYPYQIQVAYEAGLPTGTANQPDVLLALTQAAQINLNEMTFPSLNEGVGDVGITDFASMDYRETRKDFKRTVFGSSAKSAFIAHLLDGAIRKARPRLYLR